MGSGSQALPSAALSVTNCDRFLMTDGPGRGGKASVELGRCTSEKPLTVEVARIRRGHHRVNLRMDRGIVLERHCRARANCEKIGMPTYG